MSLKLSQNHSKPDFSIESRCDGLVCGIDEVGRGPLAGPVVAACVIIPDDIKNLDFVSQLNDSKKVAPKKREYLFDEITSHCIYGVAQASVREIDDINILQASLLAMKRAYLSMGHAAQMALVDGNKLPPLPCKAQAIVKGDSVSSSIAAASILAKVTRDRMMQELDVLYPGYGWNTNAGYGAKVHMDALDSLGITPHHRTTFAPIRNRLEILALESA